MSYAATIGLEIHTELKTKTKMFCSSLNDPSEVRPNINICPICMGHPGTLPVINRNAVKKVIQVGLTLHGHISDFSQFERKNYFYPDLPKGYQISQYQHPLVRGGYLEIEVPEEAGGSKSQIQNSPAGVTWRPYGAGKSQSPGKSHITNRTSQTRRIRIQRIHLEEDTGRSIHDPKTQSTLLDFNRAGVPLMELVTEPEMHSAEEARRFSEELRLILQYLEASDADMEKGEMRIEANVSLATADSTTLGTKVELKNINSFRFVELAIAAEIERQRKILESGKEVLQETRGWDEANGRTVAQRSKEASRDYRYFPEPDLPPLHLEPWLIEELRAGLPELPQEKFRRFQSEFGIDPKLIRTIIADRHLANFFEATASELAEWLRSDHTAPASSRPLQLAANYLTTDVLRLLSDADTPIQTSRINPENFAELMTYLAEGKISSKVAKAVLREMVSNGADPSIIIEEKKLWQISEVRSLTRAVEAALAAHPKAASDYRTGKTTAVQFLVGQVMSQMRGAKPEVVQRLLEEKLK